MRSAARSVLYVQADAGLYGSGVSLLELASRLPRQRYRPLVALPEEGPLAEALRSREVIVVTFPFGALRRTSRPDQIAAILRQNITGARRLSRLIREHSIALVHTNSTHVLSSAIAARSTGRPHIGHIRENILPPKPVSRALARLVWSLSDRVIAVSRATASEFLGARSDHPKVRIIYNGVDLNAFHPRGDADENRTALGWPRRHPHIGVIARLAPWKGHQVFLEAAARMTAAHPTARFVIIGDADTPRNQAHKERLLALSHRLGIADRVLWMGFVSPVQPLLAALDLVVVPSLRPEPFGRSLVEAMAMERPVIATNHGGPVEILAHGGGLLAPPADPEALASAARDLLDDPVARAAMGKAGREQACARFSIEAHVEAVVALYDEMLGEGGR